MKISKTSNTIVAQIPPIVDILLYRGLQGPMPYEPPTTPAEKDPAPHIEPLVQPSSYDYR